jgi:hypothetical protein
MVISTHSFESQGKGIRRRAAEIRQNWSASEKVARTGLPPDMPNRLRRHLVGRAEISWTVEADWSLFPWRPVCEP